MKWKNLKFLVRFLKHGSDTLLRSSRKVKLSFSEGRLETLGNIRLQRKLTTLMSSLNFGKWLKWPETYLSQEPRMQLWVELNQIVFYGGATGGGSLAHDELFLLDMRGTDYVGIFSIFYCSASNRNNSW